MGLFDFLKPDKKIKKVNYNDVIDLDGTIYVKGEKYTGIVEFLGGKMISEYLEGEKINTKQFFMDGSTKSIKELVNGELIEIKGWVKVDKKGNYNESGKKVLVREYKDGKKYEYYHNGNIKSESDVSTKKSKFDVSDTYTEIKYWENGTIQKKEVLTKHDETGNNGGVTIEYKSFYETGELQKEKVEDKKYPTKYISYHKSGKIESISISKTQYQIEGFKFEFDENGNEISKNKKQSKEEKSVRKYLNIENSNEELSDEPIERKILSHEIMTKGLFSFESKSGDCIEVFGQRHILYSITEVWNKENNEWVNREKDEIDEFHLTDYDKGYKYDESDLYDFFDIEEDGYPEWDFNGSSYDWCGIEDEDNYDTRLKKWNDYKEKFPNVSSKTQFEIN